MDKDPGPHVWNYAFDRYKITKDDVRASDPHTHDYSMDVFFAGNSWPSTYTYSITYDDAGNPVHSRWEDNSSNPDFLWRDRGGAEGYDHSVPAGRTQTNLEYKMVMELLNKSYAAEDARATANPPANPQ